MKFSELIQIVGKEPVFETGFLLAGDVDPNLVRKQLSLWTKAGKLLQLRRGVYALAAPFQKSKPHPFLIANHLVRGSYVSCQSALAYYDMIPEYVPTIISVTTQRPGRWETDLGSFEFRHVKPELFYGYRVNDVGDGQTALVATPEKALLDLIYLHSGGDAPAYLHELRLQNLEQLDWDNVQRYVDQAQSQKLRRAASGIIALAGIEAEAYETL